VPEEHGEEPRLSVTDRGSRPLEAIYRLSDAVAHAAGVQEVIGAAMDGLIDAVQADRASVLLFDEEGVMRFAGWRGISDGYRAAVEGHTPWTPDEVDAHPITIGDVAAEPSLGEPLRRTVLDEGIQAMAFVPLLSAGRLIGKFMVYHDHAHEFTEIELQLCQTIAGHVAFAIERMRSERVLRDGERRLRLALDAGRMGTWEWRLDSNTIHWSPGLEVIHGLEPGTFDSTFQGFQEDIHPEDLERVLGAIERARETGEELRIEYRIVRPDGTERWVEGRGRLFRDDSGAPPRMVGVCGDVTERKIIEETLRRSKDDLERRVAERTSELQSRADQLRRLASELTRAEQRERQRLAKVLHDHLQQLLVSAKMSLEAFGMRASGQPDHPLIERGQRCLEEAVDVCRSLTVELSPPILHEGGLAGGFEWLARWMHDTHGLTVDLALDPHVDPVREDVRTVIFGAARELLFNVVKHAKVRHASLELSCPDERHLRVRVSDGGSGFDPEPVLTRAGAPESGFGLVEIRERLALMGGRLEVESAPGRGASLTIVMPRHVESGRAEVPPSQERAAHRSGARRPAARHTGPHDRLRVLVVDDHAVLREGLCMLLLEEPRLEVVGEASDGAEAVERAHALQPDVVLMDFSMPGMNGVEATRRITGELPHVKVIGLSMYDEADRARAMLDAGAVAYVSKNGKARALIELIRARALAS
jgi:PAS domain S-box-containing protein